MFLALGEITDGLGMLIGGIFNTFPHTSFSQNVGLVAVTGIKKRTMDTRPRGIGTTALCDLNIGQPAYAV